MTPYRAILCAIALERFAWYCFLGMLALWRNPAAVGTLLAPVRADVGADRGQRGLGAGCALRRCGRR